MEANTPDSEKLRKAKERAKDKIDFVSHLCVYLFVNSILIVINLFQSGTLVWAIFPIVGWGFGLAIHFLSVFMFDGWFKKLEAKFVEQELRK